jgi:hypothetical protein
MQLRGNLMEEANITAWVGHSLSTTAILGAVLGWFPPIAAAAAFCWYCVQLYESVTVQKFFMRRRTHKIARLRAKIKMLETLETEKAEEEK